MIDRIITYGVRKLSLYLLGYHPNNTILSFNYFNVSHIRNFLTEKDAELRGDQLVLLDIGGGSSPYYYIFAKKCSRFITLDVDDCLPKNLPPGITALWDLPG